MQTSRGDLSVGSGAQLYERLFRAALAVEHDEFERMRAVRELHAAARVDRFDAESQVSLDSRARVRERAGHAFDHRDTDRRASRRALRMQIGGWNRRRQHHRGRHRLCPLCFHQRLICRSKRGS